MSHHAQSSDSEDPLEVATTALSNIWRKWENIVTRFGKLEVS